MIINSISAKAIKDSRNQPTIEISINGQKASAPSGKSTGKYETPPYHNSLQWNINLINQLKIPPPINNFQDLEKLEQLIVKKAKLSKPQDFGANALFALESAILKALAKENNKQLWQIINPRAKKFPIPLGNAIGGGLHSHNQNHPEFQEFLIIPQEKTIKANVQLMNKIHKELKSILQSNSQNDEGAWQTSSSNEEVLQLLSEIPNIKIGIDVAASSFYKNNKYDYKNKSLSPQQQIDYINYLIDNYNIYYIEDPLQEEDFQGFSKINKQALVTGDDLTATHIERLKRAIKWNSINAMIIKPNQNGSLLEVQKIFNICKKYKIKTILSHRSGETLDDAIADLAFAFQTDFIKTGISGKEREVKLQRLIEIEKSLTC